MKDDISTGIVFITNSSGIITQMLNNTINVPADDFIGKHLARLFIEDNESKVNFFLDEIKRNGSVFNWEFNMEFDNVISTFHFAGSIVREFTVEYLLVIGSKSLNGMSKLFEDMMRMNNEQVNVIRLLNKEIYSPKSGTGDITSDIYEKLSSLNNELVNIQRELARKNFELEKANSLKNQFLGVVAHDLRNPLGVILGYTDFLLDEGSKTFKTEHIEFINIIKRSSEFMLNLINELLDYSAIESGEIKIEPEVFEFNKMILNSVQLNSVLAEAKKIKIIFTGINEKCEIYADLLKIEQVLNNLITNAVKYSYSGSEVNVKLKKEDGFAIVSVEDKGIGIKKEDIEKLFKPFSKLTSKGTAGEKSIGLGLLIVKRIIKEHKGDIWVVSEPEKGSVFSFKIPLFD